MLALDLFDAAYRLGALVLVSYVLWALWTGHQQRKAAMRRLDSYGTPRKPPARTYTDAQGLTIADVFRMHIEDAPDCPNARQQYRGVISLGAEQGRPEYVCRWCGWRMVNGDDQ